MGSHDEWYQDECYYKRLNYESYMNYKIKKEKKTHKNY